MEEMTELGTKLFYVLLHTLFVTNNYLVQGCYVIESSKVIHLYQLYLLDLKCNPI